MSVMDIICWYQQFELLISTKLFVVDVDNWYCRYQHVRAIIPIFDIDNWFYCMHVLLISTIGIVDISNVRTLLISTIRIVDITDAQSQQYQLLISANNCGYSQFELWISTIQIADIDNYIDNYLSMSILTIQIADIKNWYCCNWNCWYRQLELSISLIPIFDIDNWYYCVHVLLISTFGIIDIYIVRTLLISTIIDNFNCRYQ